MFCTDRRCFKNFNNGYFIYWSPWGNYLSTQFLNPASQTCICFSLFCVFFLYTVFLLSFCLSQVQTVCVIENMHEKHVETHRLTSFSRIRQTFSHTNILPMHTYTNSRFLHNVRADGDSMPVYSWLGRTQDQVFMLPFWSCVVCIWRCSFSSAWDGAPCMRRSCVKHSAGSTM